VARNGLEDLPHDLLAAASHFQQITSKGAVPKGVVWKAAGARVVRVDAYKTRLGAIPEQCAAERRMLDEGAIHAVAFTSTAEVSSPACASCYKQACGSTQHFGDGAFYLLCLEPFLVFQEHRLQ
jgi:hypothetical protein